MVFDLQQWQIIAKVFDLEIFVLYLHSRTDVYLHGQHTFQGASLFIKVDQVGGLVAINPMLMVIPFH